MYARNSGLLFNLNVVEIGIDTLTKDREVVGCTTLNLFIAQT